MQVSNEQAVKQLAKALYEDSDPSSNFFQCWMFSVREALRRLNLKDTDVDECIFDESYRYKGL